MKPRRKCEADGCTRAVPSAVLMCPLHWRPVPAPLKAAVNATWDTRRTAVGTRAYELAVAEHEAAKNDAREAVAASANEARIKELEAENAHLRAALRLACQELRGPS